MSKPDDKNVPAAFAPHLQPGETVKFYGYGVKQPNIGIILVGFLLGLLPGVILTAILTKHYLIALTERRFLVMQVSSMGNQTMKELIEYDLATLNPAMVQASTGVLFTHIRVTDPAKPFVAKFHRLGMKTNREHCQAIAAAITQKQLVA